MIISKIKTYAIIAGSALLGVLLIAVKFLAGQNTRLRVENKIAKAKEKHVKKVMKADNEIEEQADERLVDAVKEISEGGTSDELSDPDNW